MSKSLYARWCIFNAKRSPAPDKCILAIPGRSQSGAHLAQMYDYELFKNTLIVGITPYFLEWYPMPNGPTDQSDAIMGQGKAIEAISGVLDKIKSLYGISPERTALVGYSAGAVMAIQTAVHLPYQFPVVICHAGAILEPDRLPDGKDKTTDFYLLHNKDDDSFSWNERFIPMKMAMSRQSYRVKTIEQPSGGHILSPNDAEIGAQLIYDRFKQIS